MPPEQNSSKIEKLMKQNSDLIKQNNELLKKIHRNGVLTFWLRIAWYVVILGLPFALYFYIVEPYFTALGSDYATFKAGIDEIPGLKGLGNLLDSLSNRNY